MSHFVGHGGVEIGKDELLDQFVRETSSEFHGQGVLAADMDHTMFDKDLGILVFLEKLSDPHFWDFSPSYFTKLLLPDLYRRLLERGKNGEILNLNPKYCALALDLFNDASSLYNLLHRLKGNGNGSARKVLPPHVVQVFARKMLEFDRLFLIMDRYLSKHTGGQLLLRTRFFAGKAPGQIRDFTKRIFTHTDTSPDPDLSLLMTDEHRESVKCVHQKVDEQRLSDVHGDESSLYHRVDRVVHPVWGTHELMRGMVRDLDIPGVVITANLYGIAATALGASKEHYGFLADQSFHRGDAAEPYVIGTRLRRRTEKQLLPEVDGLPVFGPQKAEEANAFAARRKGSLVAAFGDSPSTDGSLLQSSVEQGGYAFVVGRDFASTCAKFREVFDPLLKTSADISRRIFYIVESA
ncbi:MAG: hypothetical protein AAB551_00885 [Patescibacteria group bacterium]